MRTIAIPPARHGGCMCILHSTPRAGLPRSAQSRDTIATPSRDIGPHPAGRV